MEDTPQVKLYHKTRRILSVTGFLLDVAVLVTLLFAGWSISLRSLATNWSAHPALALLIYLIFLGVITKAVGLPLDFVRGLWLEHRHGLSNLTVGGWFKDQLKGFAVGGVLAALGLECLYWTMRRWPAYWWLISGALCVAFFVLLTHLAPLLIFPLFFKFKPLENPSLVKRLIALSRRAGTNVKGVFEWKLSEKSKKANAALVGLASTRRIILADTLLEKLNEDAVEAVLAHELGHHVHHHMFHSLAMQSVATFLGFYLAHVALLHLSGHFRFIGLADFANLPLLGLVGAVFSLILLPAFNAHSRYMERQADAYALRAIAGKSAFISSMEKLAELNLAERHPPGWIEFVFHSHPSTEKRLAFAAQFPPTLKRT